MLEEHALTDEERAEIEGKFLGHYHKGNYKRALKFYSSLNKQARDYIDREHHWQLLNARTTSKREWKK